MEIQGNKLTIIIPDGMTIDEENSTFECIKFKPISQTKYSDYDGQHDIKGWIINMDSKPFKFSGVNKPCNKSTFSTEKQAKLALAMAQISQIMANDERFGGVVTDEEWEDDNILKYCFTRVKIYLLFSTYRSSYEFLAFHTADQRDLFFQENEQLVKDYLMID